MIPFNLPLEIRDEIQAIPIPLIARNNDKLAWKFSPKGNFDMGSAYLLATNLMEAESFAGSRIGSFKLCLESKFLFGDACIIVLLSRRLSQKEEFHLLPPI